MPPERAAAAADYIRSRWHYDPKTGAVHNRKQGKPIGYLRKDGVLQVLIHTEEGKIAVLLHRAAWLLRTGAWPERDVDHRNGDRADNRWENLREATPGQNRQNLSTRTAKGKLRGATRHHLKWVSQIKVPGGTTKYLGLFATEEEAHAAYCKAKQELHPFNPIQR